MRKFALSAILFAFSAILLAQNETHFQTDGTAVTWQNVYQTQLDSADVAEALFASGLLEYAARTKDGFSCRIIPHRVRFNGSGVDENRVPAYLLATDMDGHATVQIRDGRYRVTVDNVFFTVTVSVGLFVPGHKASLETQALNKKGEFKKGFFSTGAATALEYDIYSLFEIKEPENDEDW